MRALRARRFNLRKPSAPSLTATATLRMHETCHSGFLRVLACGAGALLMAACAPRGAPLDGTVFEVTNPEQPPSQWIKVPLAGAEVLVIWNVRVIDNPAHTTSRCMRARFTKSDADGRYSVPGWQGSWTAARIEIEGAVSYVYRAGYEDIPPRPGEFLPAPSPGVHLMRHSQRPEGFFTREGIFAAARECPTIEQGSG